MSEIIEKSENIDINNDGTLEIENEFSNKKSIVLDSNQKSIKNFFTGEAFKWILNIIFPAMLYLVPVNDSFTGNMRLFFIVTLFVIINWAFELMPLAISAMALPIVYVLSGLATSAQAFAPWGTSLPWLFAGGMIISSVFEGTGLMKRIALWSINMAGGTYRGILLGFMISGLILCLIIPSNAARVTLFLPLAYGICQSLEIKPYTKEGAGIMLTAGFTALTPITVVDSTYLISLGIAKNFGLSLSWMEHLIQMGVMSFGITIAYTFMLMFMFKPSNSVFMPENRAKTKSYFTAEYEKLGKMKANEKKLVILLMIMVVFLCTSSIHKIDAGWLFPMLAMTFYLPGIKIADENDLKKINIQMLILMTGAMAIGSVSVVTGSGTLIAHKLVAFMSGGKFAITAFAWLAGVLVNFVLTPLAAASGLTAPLIEAAQSVGINPFVIMHSFAQGLEQLLLPYEYVLALMIFSYKMFTLKTFVKAYAAKMIVNFLFLMLICVPYWTLLGMF